MLTRNSDRHGFKYQVLHSDSNIRPRLYVGQLMFPQFICCSVQRCTGGSRKGLKVFDVFSAKRCELYLEHQHHHSLIIYIENEYFYFTIYINFNYPIYSILTSFWCSIFTNPNLIYLRSITKRESFKRRIEHLLQVLKISPFFDCSQTFILFCEAFNTV